MKADERERIISYQGITPFEFNIRYVEADADTPNKYADMHIHEECQIYINLTGDVEFMVEDHLYPIVPGSIMIVRPYELHHCIYRRSGVVHKHFCIYFTADGNEGVLKRFFERQAGQDNLIFIPGDDISVIKDICYVLLDGSDNPILQYRSFFQLMAMLEGGELTYGREIQLPDDVRTAIKYISENLQYPITIGEAAKAAHVSINTLERHFLSAIQVSPGEFLKQRRLNKARSLLIRGASVTEAAEQSGFSDCSYFIDIFKKKYGTTPYRYKKQRGRS